MKAERLTTEKQVDSFVNRGLKIQTYGEKNDYPQRVDEIVEASETGSSCVRLYSKFIIGRGFSQERFFKSVVDSKGSTVDALLQSVAEDFAKFGGFAIHVNYNALFEITSASHVPFEWLRFEEFDEAYRFDRMAMHQDWGRRYTKLRPFRPKDIEFFHFFNPDPDVVAKEVAEAGGWNGYKGQILYYSNRGDRVYPTPIYNAALTDMSTEEGLANITLRNVRSNFLPAGMVIDYDQTANSEEQQQQTKDELKAFQGDTNAGLLMYVNIKNGDKAPDFVPFKGENYDKAFENADKKVPDNIGRSFNQPPILRAVDVGANFGADLMRNAYDFYNAVTESERMVVEQAFKRIFDHWHDAEINPEQDYEILPKVYRINATLAERLGNNVDKVLELLFDMTKPVTAKIAVFKTVYGLENADINELMKGLI